MPVALTSTICVDQHRLMVTVAVPATDRYPTTSANFLTVSYAEPVATKCMAAPATTNMFATQSGSDYHLRTQLITIQRRRQSVHEHLNLIVVLDIYAP